MKRLPFRHGFTLLEVLIALAVFSVAALTVLVQLDDGVSQLSRQEQKTFALWIAENKIAELRLQSRPPAQGRNTEQISMAGRSWQLSTEVETTAGEGIRQINVTVFSEDEPDKEIVKLFGFMGEH